VSDYEELDLIGHEKAAEILGYKSSSGTVYDALKPLRCFRVRGARQWVRQEVEKLAADRPKRSKNPVSLHETPAELLDFMSYQLTRIEKKLDEHAQAFSALLRAFNAHTLEDK
jgi:hypothetical protein